MPVESNRVILDSEGMPRLLAGDNLADLAGDVGFADEALAALPAGELILAHGCGVLRCCPGSRRTIEDAPST
jgi:hypothetical protein